MKKEVKTNNKGFSLVELIVVVAIMAVLMVVLAPAMLRYVEKTRKQKDDTAASEVANALELALAEESIYTKVSGNNTITATITVDAAGNGTISVTNDTSTGDIKKEIDATVGDLKFVSKARKSSTCTIKAEYKSTRQAYVVEFDTSCWS